MDVDMQLEQMIKQGEEERKREEEEEENEETMNEEEEVVNEEEEEGISEEEAKDEVKNKMTSLTRLSDDEEEPQEIMDEESGEIAGGIPQNRSDEEINEKPRESATVSEKKPEKQPQSEPSKPNSSELLVLGPDGKLRKSKPKVNLMDLFQRAKEKKSQTPSEVQEIDDNLFDKEEDYDKETDHDKEKNTDKEEDTGKENDTDSIDGESVDSNHNSTPEDENDYNDHQPTAEDYIRYKEMMKEARHEHFDLLDSEAEESGDDISIDHELEEKENGTLVIPEGIDIMERAVTENERRDVLNLHRRIKEQEDEEQIEYVKKGIREGPAYIWSRR